MIFVIVQIVHLVVYLGHFTYVHLMRFALNWSSSILGMSESGNIYTFSYCSFKDGFFLSPFEKQSMLNVHLLKTAFPQSLECFFFFLNWQPSGLFLLGSCRGNNEFSATVMLSSILCARVANSSKDFGLMPCKI